MIEFKVPKRKLKTLILGSAEAIKEDIFYKPQSPQLDFKQPQFEPISKEEKSLDSSDGGSQHLLNKKREHERKEDKDNFHFSSFAPKERASQEESNCSIDLKNVNDAFVYDDSNTEEHHDSYAMKTKNIQISKLIKEGKIDTKLYRGQNAYAIYADKSERDLSNYKVTGSLGPMRVNTNIKAISQIDYARGICKDYKNAGVCGYGDGCIFMHDRGDYKSSWEIDEELKKKEHKRQLMLKKGLCPEEEEKKASQANESKAQRENGELKCPICCKMLENPVSTICNHNFCQSCALQHYATSKLCFICKKRLEGIFNVNHQLTAKLKLKSANTKL